MTPAVAEPPLPGGAFDVLECCAGLIPPISLLTSQKLFVDFGPVPPNKVFGIDPCVNPCDGPNVPRGGSGIDDNSLLDVFVFPAVWDVMTKDSGDCWGIWGSSC